jgi:transitional endoplasmic reticulum ATPase
MSDNAIDSLRDALGYSPENVALRLLLADTLLTFNRLEEAEVEYATILRSSDEPKAKVGLAKVFYQRGSYSACNVVLEELIESDERNLEALVLHARALLKEKSIGKAMEMYKKVLAIEPNFQDEALDQAFRMTGRLDDSIDDDDGDDELENRFLQKPNMNFSDVGGMDGVKREIELKIIKPLQHQALYKAYGKKTGGGILLYGPPGCGKTFIAKATAGEANAKFLSVSLNDILDMWIGNSEKNLHEIFELARNNNPCVLFIDEIDALGASRSDMKQSAGKQLINQFLLELDGIDFDNEGVLILGATNTPWHLDAAFRRPGRFDRIIFVPPPDEAAREAILRLKLVNKPVDSIDYAKLAKQTENYSGADLDALIDIAIEQKLEAAFLDGIAKPIETKDLLAAVKKHRASTQEWFATAKNFALFANDSGLYDDILTYLKIKK